MGSSRWRRRLESITFDSEERARRFRLEMGPKLREWGMTPRYRLEVLPRGVGPNRAYYVTLVDTQPGT